VTDAAPGMSAQGERRSRDASAAPSLLGTLQVLWQELPGLISDRVELLSLELRRAGIALAQIVVLVLAAVILAVTAWLVLWGGIVVALVSAGMHTALALLVAVAINLGAAAWAFLRSRRLLPLLSLPATQRHLMIDPSTITRAPVDSPVPPAGPPHDRIDPLPAGPPVAH
jgi:uncharacterized membrane protein YqjE